MNSIGQMYAFNPDLYTNEMMINFSERERVRKKERNSPSFSLQKKAKKHPHTTTHWSSSITQITYVSVAVFCRGELICMCALLRASGPQMDCVPP